MTDTSSRVKIAKKALSPKARKVREERKTTRTNQRTVILAGEVGFCFGVKRAINLTRQALVEREDVFILGDLVHNKSVTAELEAKGLKKTDDFENRTSGTMVIRAHGLPKESIQEAKNLGLDVVNATCPIVLRAQEAAQSLQDRGCQVVIIGDANHAEIKGIMGALEKPALVINTVEELRKAKEEHRLLRKVGVIFQTTHALEMCYPIVNELIYLCKEVQIINTICRPVQNRQDDALDLASHVDLMIVVGSSTSANTMELYSLCRYHNPKTMHIECASQLRPDDFTWANTIGVASGLSTPVDLVEEVRNYLIDYEDTTEEADSYAGIAAK